MLPIPGLLVCTGTTNAVFTQSPLTVLCKNNLFDIKDLCICFIFLLISTISCMATFTRVAYLSKIVCYFN